MPPSQLKRLKASLREQGIVGPQQSKKQKKQNAQSGANKEKKIRRSVALNGIREQFNPFEIKTSKAPKFEVTSNKTLSGRISKGIKRPGVAKGLGEENRRKTLLVEMQSRNRVGGIIDKRFGENDPSMAPEDKMLERFTQEKQRGHKNNSVFDLEDDDMPGELTHMGQSLSLNGPAIRDDFEDEEIELSDAEDHQSDEERQARKRRRLSGSEGSEGDEEGENLPERKKSKQEVMKEVIAKSKLYKYERQAAKDEDEDLREELDKELPNLHELLRGVAPKPAPETLDIAGMNPERAALLSGGDRKKLEKEYDVRMRQMAQDKRSQPTERSKTEDEKIEQESRRLRELEEKRLRRMEGMAEDSDNEDNDRPAGGDDDVMEDEEEDFGLGSGIKIRPSAAELGADDEDDFVIDDELVASGSDLDPSDDESSAGEEEEADDEDDEFLGGLLTEEEAKRPEFLTGANAPLPEVELPARNGVNGNLAYTFACPESHEELLEITKGIAVLDLPTVVQRIRALYHPKLNADNKGKLGNFAVALVSHISYLANQPSRPPFNVLENIIRHIHSLAKMFPLEIANAFRGQLEEINQSRALSLTSGDLVILTAIGNVFPTSDHFHQVVTPAILTMGRYLGQKIPQTLSDYTLGAYLCTLCLQYQRLSKRYVPEVGNFIENTLCALAPIKLSKMPGSFPYHEPKTSVRTEDASVLARDIGFYDCVLQDLPENDENSLKIALLETNIKLLDASADLWTGKSAFTEIFGPALTILKHLGGKACRSKIPKSSQEAVRKTSDKLERMLKLAHLARRPLELHHHRPLAIKTSIPKFEDSFNPDKHYDPDRERAEAAKLRAEHKKERKGAMRELRKDSNFIARESLRQKKEKDAAHEKKMKRLIAEIQGEEGKEAKAYEREKEWRKKGKK
ncbi:nop14-like family protein [Rutstroemia sp. NJR-2017a BVV2]|nr:nop14-like family protein [Rutstroemia sp. NJR-2017a BVV2]